MRIIGIGGTGVVTVAQTIATAALLDGRFVRGLDQTGLAQKGGPVVSDLRITTTPMDQANKLAAADCDLYLACDLLVGAQAHLLTVTDAARTVAVTSTAQVPTGQMVVDTRLSFPPVSPLLARIDRSTRSALNVALDAPAVAERLFGTDQVANMLLVGAAYQAGALPLRAESIEAALELNGVAVAANVQAFRRGRQAVADRGALDAALVSTAPAEPDGPGPRGPAALAALGPQEAAIVGLVAAPAAGELARLVASRVPMLVGYQDRAYARRYAARVERVRAAEEAVVPGSTGVAEAVAFSLFKLMAYKDEYEVARLHRDPAFRRELADRFGDESSYRVMLHPPVLKALGVQRKIAVPGRAGQAMFAALAPLKRLRGSRWDPFGRDHVRVIERELLAEYEGLLDEIVERISAENHSVAAELAALPDLVRGYDEVKLRNVETYRVQAARLRRHLADGELVIESGVGAGVGARPGAGQRPASDVITGVGARLSRIGARAARPARGGNLERDVESEGRLDPSTAALMEGAPPASTGGRAQPTRRARTGAHTDGATEAETGHLPG